MKKMKLLTTAALLSVVLLGSNTMTAAAAPADAGRQCGTYNHFVYYYILKNLTQLPCPPAQLPDNNLPDCNLPDTDLPDNNLPGDNTPDTDLPDNNLPGDNTPDIDSPDNNTPDSTPGTDLPDSNLPGDNTPGTDLPDSNLPGGNTPDTDLPDGNTPGTDLPDGNLPGGNTPGTNLPDNSTPGEDEALSYTAQVVKLVNAERAKEGLSPLTVDTNVQAAAQVRAVEIQTSFSHTRPNGSSFSTALKEQNVSYRSAGENIAWGQRSPQEVVTAWMNSAGHRANIMNANFTKIGVGYHQNANGTKYWSQLFIR